MSKQGMPQNFWDSPQFTLGVNIMLTVISVFLYVVGQHVAAYLAVVLLVIGLGLMLHAYLRDRKKHIMNLDEALARKSRMENYWTIAYYSFLGLLIIGIIGINCYRIFYLDHRKPIETTINSGPTISSGLMKIIKTDADIATLPTFIDPSQQISISLGENGASYEYTWSDFQSKTADGEEVAVPFSQFGITFYAYVSNDRISVNASLYGSQENPLVQISSNSLVSLPSNWDDYHYNVALEIVDNNQDPVFQLIYETPFHLVINGIFPTNNGILYATDLGLRNNAVPISNFHLNSIFRYPSSKYPSQVR